MKIAALIATSMGRCDLLIDRSLTSVLGQTRKPDAVIVVDDNANDLESDKIRNSISCIPGVTYLRNTHAHGMSGTGAWNTGIEYIAEAFGPDCYVAILDDDDEWMAEHLSECEAALQGKDAKGVFPWIYRTDLSRALEFSRIDLSIKNFLVGNPGIQGSNMVISADALMDIRMFDENLSSCTDRDLMIRVLTRYKPDDFIVVPKVTVIYHASKDSVTYDSVRKYTGLDAFYSKHLTDFPDRKSLQLSLKRARELFGYRNDSLLNEYDNQGIIAIGVAMHNNEATIARCLSSIAMQTGVSRHIKVIIGDDTSSDAWQTAVNQFKDNLDIEILHFDNKNVVRTRNAINDYIVKHVPAASFIGRLDADDEYASNEVLSKIEELFDKTGSDVVIGGNGYLIDGELADYGNWDNERLTDIDYLKERVRGMAEGNPNAELPSCNMFI